MRERRKQLHYQIRTGGGHITRHSRGLPTNSYQSPIAPCCAWMLRVAIIHAWHVFVLMAIMTWATLVWAHTAIVGCQNLWDDPDSTIVTIIIDTEPPSEIARDLSSISGRIEGPSSSTPGSSLGDLAQFVCPLRNKRLRGQGARSSEFLSSNLGSTLAG